MLAYEPGDTVCHRLDPRGKLAFQAAFALAAFAHTTPRGLFLLTPVAGAVLAAGRLSPLRAVWEYRFLFPFLAAAPVLTATTLGDPWVSPAAAVPPLLASYRVVLVLFVAAVYVRTTPVRESRAAIQRLVPGKLGLLLGTGVGLTLRFLPLLQRDLRAIRDASEARLGDRRPLHERMQHVTIAGLSRAFGRADRLSLALQARCFAWNPTLPALRMERRDWAAIAGAVGLLSYALGLPAYAARLLA